MDTETISKKEQLFHMLRGASPSVLEMLSPGAVKQAHELLAGLDFPTTRQEDWKYTRTTRLQNENWIVRPHQEPVDINPYIIPDLDATILVFVNGFFRQDLCRMYVQEGVVTKAFSQLNEQERLEAGATVTTLCDPGVNLFTAINTAFCTDGMFIRVATKTAVQKPVHLIFLQSGLNTLSLPRMALRVGSSASLHLVTTFASLDHNKAWMNGVTEITVEENASLRWDKIQCESDENFSLLHEYIFQEANSNFEVNTLTVDGGWVRNTLNISVAGQNSETHLNGFYLPRRSQHIDNHTLVDHLVPHCNSNELYKGVLYDKGRAVFNGKVYVRPDAQKTNAYQNNANIMISDEASVNTKPELEIYADDVKCSHGTTTGQFNEEALFYLRARGLSHESARKLLVSAFIQDVLDKVKSEAVRIHVRTLLLERGLMTE